jgi:hypothetical protein
VPAPARSASIPTSSLQIRRLQAEQHLAARGAKAFLTGSNRSLHSLHSEALEATDKTDCSNRTERRYVTEKIKNVTDALCQIVFPTTDLDRDCPDEGTQYGDTAFLDLQSYLGVTGTAANQANQMFDDETTREAGGPAGHTHLQYIKQLDAMEIASMINGAIAKMVWAAEQYSTLREIATSTWRSTSPTSHTTVTATSSR